MNNGQKMRKIPYKAPKLSSLVCPYFRPSLLCPYFRQSELRTPFDSTQYQWLKYGHISDTTMSVCVRMSVVSVFQSHPFQVLTKIIFLRHSHIHSTLTRYTIEISYGKL